MLSPSDRGSAVRFLEAAVANLALAGSRLEPLPAQAKKADALTVKAMGLLKEVANGKT